MVEWLSKSDKWLPHWLETTQLLWLQWLYALWQLVHGNPLTLLLLSFLPFKVAQRRNRKTVVVVGASKDYSLSDRWQTYVENLGIGLRPIRGFMFFAEHRGHTYLTHQNTLFELAECSRVFEKNIIFVERLLPVTHSLAVGRKLSLTEAYEKIFTKLYHCGKGPDYIIPTCLDYGTDLNSKIWGVLSTIPVLLQARNYNRLSTLLSLVIIFLDLNKGWLYKVYDDLFYRFAKLVKLNVFKKKTAWYDFCSIFSSRWRYSDTVNKYSYVAQQNETLTIRRYCKWETFSQDPNDQHIYMEIVKDRAHCSLKEYGDYYTTVTLRKPVYVS